MQRSNNNFPIDPLCRFGPGGDFTSVWPQDKLDISHPQENVLSKVLGSIAEIMEAVLTPEMQDGSIEITYPKVTSRRIIFPKGQLKNAEIYEPKTTHAQTTTALKDNSQLSGQPMLFPDDYGISDTTGHKQKHRVRTPGRIKKKKAPVSIFGQGSLFEDNLQSAKTA
jgi:hypothetical protein